MIVLGTILPSLRKIHSNASERKNKNNENNPSKIDILFTLRCESLITPFNIMKTAVYIVEIIAVRISMSD